MSPNLREQKRRATLAAIEEHASKLVADNGFDNVTIDDICQAANISKRTFFNYVESKEVAVLGALPTPIAEECTAAFVKQEHPDLLSALLQLSLDNFAAAISPGVDAGELFRRRKAILRANPDLWLSRMATFNLLHDSIVRTAATYLEQHDSARQLRHLTPITEARLVVGITGTAMEVGFKTWFATPDATLTQLPDLCKQALADMRRLARTEGGDK